MKSDLPTSAAENPVDALDSAGSELFFDAALGALIGLTGGFACAVAGLTGYIVGPLLGTVAGSVFAALTTERARTAGAGLLWALAFALLGWFAVLYPHSRGTMPIMDAARAHFALLVGALLLVGAPLGLVVGGCRARVSRLDADVAQRFSLCPRTSFMDCCWD